MEKKIISVGANKGGTGKSALALFAGIVSAENGKRCAVFDMDSQCGLSFRVPGAVKLLRRNLVKLIASGKDFEFGEMQTGKNLWFIPGDLAANVYGEREFDKETVDRVIERRMDSYDVQEIDSGPRPTKIERHFLSKGDVHFLPAGSDKASVVGVIYRMIDVFDSVGALPRDRFFFIPWGVNTSEKTGKNAQLVENMAVVMDEFGMSVLPPFPPVQDMTDFICGLDSMDLSHFLKYPGIARKRKNIIEWADILCSKIDIQDKMGKNK